MHYACWFHSVWKTLHNLLGKYGVGNGPKNQNSSAILMHDLVGGHGFTGLALGYWLLLLLRVLVPSVNIS